MEYTEFYEFLNTVAADNCLSHLIDEQKSRKLYFLMTHMLEVNKSMNLTAIKEEKGIVVRHFLDSLTVAAFLPENATILDVGCGAGFPCLPLGICRPDLRITALDSTEKRIKYVRDTAKALEIPHFTAITARAEELGHDAAYRARFDAVTARAVAALPALAELSLPFVRIGGHFIAMKARKGEEELSAARTAIEKLGGTVRAVHALSLTDGAANDERLLIDVEKTSPTPEALPRAWGKILKKPL
ncbi:MAG: 16S rRNA (guanine(527)-N(7))-methyltransferase RsmG [Ruminococcaceae bacterium]|nr:16S rRNA (guanine(527)-N(7))-methyltransferase RsmG [Oscillospiraceae bacterium]